MRARPAPARLAAAVLLLLAATGRADALETGKYRFDPGGRVLGVRPLDVDRDGRPDLVALVEEKGGGTALLVLRTPAEPVARSFYPPDHVIRLPLAADLRRAGAVAVGRFGPHGEPRIRLLGPRGIRECVVAGAATKVAMRDERPTLLGRSVGRLPVFWDGVADLDGDGIDEMWYPLAAGDGPLQVLAGRPAGDRVLTLAAANDSSSSELNLVSRTARVPNLFPADLDGDGTRELVALQEGALVAWSLQAEAGSAPVAPTWRLALPFLAPDPKRGPEDMHTPRIQIEDVDRDGVSDLLVTLVTGKRSRVESLRTIFFHYPGPFRDPKTGGLVAPRARIDTESAVLHPAFVDVDGDGDLEYVGDSIRGSRMELIARVLGKAPTATYVGFRFDEEAGSFEAAPYFSIDRTYPSSEALSNRFGRCVRIEGDFDGDGHLDLLDLGELGGVQVLRGGASGSRTGAPFAFREELVPEVPVKEGLVADSVVLDLNADGRSDAVLWSKTSLFFLVSEGAR